MCFLGNVKMELVEHQEMPQEGQGWDGAGARKSVTNLRNRRHFRDYPSADVQLQLPI